MMLRSLVRCCYSQAYSKFRISRTPQEAFVFFFKNEITVKGLLESIRQNFAVNNNILLAASAFEPTLLGYAVLPEAQRATEELGEELLLPLLISGELFIYEGVNGRVQLCYGIECEEFNQTNNRNVPAELASCLSASPTA